MRWQLAVLVLVVLVVASCGDGATTATTEPTVPPQTTQTTAPEPTFTTEPATTEAPAPTATTTTMATSTTAAGPTAYDALAEFFAAAEAADAEIADVAERFNAGFDPEKGTLTTEAKTAVEDLSLDRLDWLIPAGLSEELETAALTVYSDLVSRAAAVNGGARYLAATPEPDKELREQNLEFTMTCLGNGHDANARFDDDLARAERLARSEAPPPEFAPDSDEAGILAVRAAGIDGANWCCDSCGGFIYTEPASVDWEGRTGFDAEFVDGHWEIQLHAG
jgi:hypothetical protein